MNCAQQLRDMKAIFLKLKEKYEEQGASYGELLQQVRLLRTDLTAWEKLSAEQVSQVSSLTSERDRLSAEVLILKAGLIDLEAKLQKAEILLQKASDSWKEYQMESEKKIGAVEADKAILEARLATTEKLAMGGVLLSLAMAVVGFFVGLQF